MSRPPARNLAIMPIDPIRLHKLLRLPEGQRVVGIGNNWPSTLIQVLLEGEGLPEVPDGGMPPWIGEPENYLDMELRDKLDAFVRTYTGGHQVSRDVQAILRLLRKILDGGFDPRYGVQARKEYDDETRAGGPA